MMLNLIPQVQFMIEKELTFDDSKQERPHLFMFDIQDEQVDSLQSFIKDNGLNVGRSSPMVRGRLVKINDTPFVMR